MDTQSIRELFQQIRQSPELQGEFRDLLIESFDLRKNPFHPLVFVHGDPEIGSEVYIGLFSEVNAKGGVVRIGNHCDIASFVSINAADSHKLCIGISEEIERGTIVLEEHVFVGSHSFIGGNTSIGHHSVVAAGTKLINGGDIPPYSLVVGSPAKTLPGYYRDKIHPA